MNTTKKLGPVDILAKFFKWFFLIFFLLFMILPLVWILISSFKTNLEFNIKSPFALPEVWQFSNYRNAFSISNLPRMFLHSIIVAIVTTALNLVVAAMSAFALSAAAAEPTVKTVAYIDENGKSVGSYVATGLQPGFLEKFRMNGVEIPSSIFQGQPGMAKER